MNIYLLTQNACQGYDTYDSCVVYAESEERAKLIHPCGGHFFGVDMENSYEYKTNNWEYNDWAKNPEDVKVKYLGTVDNTILKDIKEGVILSSFNAG